MTEELAAACANAFHVLRADGTTLQAGRAAVYVLGRVGWPKTAAVLAVPPFLWIVELGYRLVADHRLFWDRVLFRRYRP